MGDTGFQLPQVTVSEVDGSPRRYAIQELEFSNGTVTVSGNKATIATGGAIGSPVLGGTANCILFIDGSGNLGQDTSFTYDTSVNAFSIANTAYSTNSSFAQITSNTTSTKSVSGTTSASIQGISATLTNQDSLTITSGKSPSASYIGLSSNLANSGRTIAGSTNYTERLFAISNISISESGNSITHSGSVTQNRYGVYSVNIAQETLNNATLNYTGNLNGGVFISSSNITNTLSGSKTITLTGVYGEGSWSGGVTPDTCYGAQFVGSGGTINYGCSASGTTAAFIASGNYLFSSNNAYSFANSTNRASGLWSVLGNFSGNVSLASASQIDWNSDVILYRNAADELRTPDSIRIDGTASVGVALDSNILVYAQKTFSSTATLQYGVFGSVLHTGGNTSSDTLSGLRGQAYVNGGANTFNNASGISGSTLIAPGQSGTITNAYGLNFSVHSQSTSGVSITNLAGVRASVVAAGASVTGTVTNAFGLQVTSSNSASSAQVITNLLSIDTSAVAPAGGIGTYWGARFRLPTSNTVTTMRGVEVWTSGGATSSSTTVEGIKINDPGSGGSITTQYGIRIQDLDYASTNYALYFDGTSGLSRQGIWWNADTNLYRSAANTLKTDDDFICANLTDSALTAGRIVFTSTGGLLASDGGFTYDGTTATFTDTFDAGGAVSVEIPNGAGGTTVNATGEICVDSTSRTVNFYDGTSEVVLDPLIEHAMYLEAPTSADDIPILRVDKAMTLVKTVYAITGGTNWVGQLQEADDAQGTNASDTQTSDSTVTGTTTVTSYSNDSFDAGDYVRLKTTSVSGSVTWLHVTFYFRTNP